MAAVPQPRRTIMADSSDCKPREWFFPILLALFLIVIGTLPYLYAASHADRQMRFMGSIDRYPENSNVYRMFIRQAMDGRFFFENRMTAEPLPRRYINLEWWLLGSLGRWFSLSQEALLHLERVLSTILLTLAAYGLSAACLPTMRQRQFATSLICVGAGLGWLVWLCAHMADCHPMTLLTFTLHGKEARFPPDIAGNNVFYHAVAFPHGARILAAGMAFGGSLIQGERTGRLRWFVLTGLALNLRCTLRPYELPESCLLLLVFPALMTVRSRRFRLRQALPYALTGFVALPVAAYNVYLFFAEPLGRLEIDSPPFPPINLLFWQGPPLIAVLVWCTGFRHLRRTPPSTLLLSLWITIAFALCYSYPYFRAGLEGLGVFHYAPAVLATQGPFAALYRWASRRLDYSRSAWLRHRRRVLLGVLPVLVILFGSISGGASAYRIGKIVSTRDPRWFMDRDQYAALQWLNEHAAPSAVVLALHQTGNWVASLTPCKTVAANWMFTPDFAAKAADAERFFRLRDDVGFKMRLVKSHRVAYVLFGPIEAAVAGDQGFRAEDFPWLVRVYQQGGNRIFAVR